MGTWNEANKATKLPNAVLDLHPPQIRWINRQISQATGLPEGVYVYCSDRGYWQFVDMSYGATAVFQHEPTVGARMIADPESIAEIRNRFKVVEPEKKKMSA